MKVHMITNEKTVIAIKNSSCRILANDDWEEGDIALFYEESVRDIESFRDRRAFIYDSLPVAYEVDYEREYARRSPMINGVSVVTVKLFEGIFESYNEAADIECTLRKFPSLTKDKLAQEMEDIVARVKKHNAIDDGQANILVALFNNEKTKKQLIDEGVCSISDIDAAFKSFSKELEYCYAFKNDRIIDRVNRFDTGERRFTRSFAETAESFSIESSLLEEIALRIVRRDVLLSEDDGNFAVSAITKFAREGDLDRDERIRLFDLSAGIVKHYERFESEFYEAHAEMLIKLNNIHFSHVNRYCDRNGLHNGKIVSAMRRLGATVDYHVRGGDGVLCDYLVRPSEIK